MPEIRVATSTEELSELRADWEALCETQSSVALSADVDRFEATVAAIEPASRPHVAVFYSRGIPCGLIAGRMQLCRVPVRFGYFRAHTPALRCLDIVYGGLICTEVESRRRMVSHLTDLLRQRKCDRLAINHLPVRHPMVEAVSSDAYLSRRCRISRVEPHWVFRLAAGSFAGTLSQLPKKRRNELSREGRRLADSFQGRLSFSVHSSPSELNEIISQSAKIASQTYHAGLGVGFVDNGIWRALLKIESDRGRLRAMFLRGGGAPIAFAIGSVRRKTLFLEAMGYLPQHSRHSPGKHLLVKIFEYCCSTGIESVDYGFGDAEYKRVFGTDKWDEGVLEFFSDCPRAVLARSMVAAASSATASATCVAEHLHLLNRLKRTWRVWLQPEQGRSQT